MKPTLWLALAGIAGLAAGAAWPPPPIPKAQQTEPEWQLPTEEALQLHSKDDFQQARQGVRWLGQESSQGVAQASGWRLVGVVTSPEPAMLAMRLDTSKVTRMKVGQALPDGSKVREIRRDRVTTELDGCQTVYQLYRPKPISTSSGCLPQGGDAE